MTNAGRGYKIRTLAGVCLLGLTACGGGSGAIPVESNVPVPAAATAAAEALEQAAEEAAKQQPVEQPVAQQAAQPATPVAVPDTGNPDQQSAALIPDQDIIDNAANVGCEAAPAEFNSTVLALVNASRSEARMCGATSHDAVSALTWNNLLAQAALAHSGDMAANNFFSHDGSDGLSVADRVETAGYPWRAVGENIAAGQVDHAEVHQGWVGSPAHCRNIMNPLFSEVGAACVRDPGTDFGTYWVVVFGDSK